MYDSSLMLRKIMHVSCLSQVVTITLVGMLYAMELPPIHWNSSNPMFKASSSDHVVEVNIGDTLDFICPYYSSSRMGRHEYFIIHQVSREEYERCHLFHNTSSSSIIINCSNPTQKKRFTIWFDEFAAIPNVPEFIRGHSYYFITTSTGDKDGIKNTAKGACYHKNMRLQVRVCCKHHQPSSSSSSSSAATAAAVASDGNALNEQSVLKHRKLTANKPPSHHHSDISEHNSSIKMSTRWPAAVPPASPSTPTTTTKSPADSSNAARAINDRILPGEEGPPSSYRSQSSNTIDHWRIKNIDSSSNRFRAEKGAQKTSVTEKEEEEEEESALEDEIIVMIDQQHLTSSTARLVQYFVNVSFFLLLNIVTQS